MVFYFLLLLPPIILLIVTASKTRQPSPPLPPGPKPWLIIGNLLQITKKPHVSLSSFSKLHGPLISLRLGSQLLVVASSPAAAGEILKTHDRLLSARFVPKSVPASIPNLNRKALIWAPDCHDGNWKTFRSIFKSELFSAKAIESQAAVRERKAAEMVDFIAGKSAGEEEIDIGEVAFATVFDSLSNLIFSRDCIGFEETATATKLKSLVWKLLEVAAAPNLADFFIILEKLDPQGLRRESARKLGELFSVWKPYVKERRETLRRGNDEGGDFLDVFLENGLDDDQIDWLNMELFVAGTDTSTTTIEWAMAELMKNKGVMDKLREELKTEFSKNEKSILKEADVYQLQYLTAIVKETLRLHPPVPLLVPHRSPETLQVMNYTIPKGARVAVNTWAIGRDRSIWGDDATSFKPERFVDSNVDFRGQDFELLPFGAGRRMCPGTPLAARQVPLLLASLVWNFDWCLPKKEDPSELDMEEKFGITLQKERPLVLIPRQLCLLSD
ncbi:(S)-N-methylcoclaurine 3'-hydroxylase isozyme 1 (Fragment) [Linum grandiflorum]